MGDSSPGCRPDSEPDKILDEANSGAGLYIHVPFCRSKCDYCAFPSSTIFSPERREAWQAAVLAQLAKELTQGQLQEQAGSWPLFTTLYVGGGTPSLLSPDELATLLVAVKPVLQPQAEITLEANPESLCESWLRVAQDHGVSRLSLGIQSFDAQVRQAVGRLSTQGDLERARDLLERVWHGQFSLDLILGLPFQTPELQLKDAEIALSWNPHHLSAYPLSWEKGTVLTKKFRESESEDLAWDEVRALWQENGYEWYEVANFARPGAQCQHNRGYWEQRPYLGIGSGAVTTYPAQRSANGEVFWRRRTFGTDPTLFFTHQETEILTPLDCRKEALLLGLRLSTGLSRAQWERCSPRPWEQVLFNTLQRFEPWFQDTSHSLTLKPGVRCWQDELLRHAFAELDVDDTRR